MEILVYTAILCSRIYEHIVHQQIVISKIVSNKSFSRLGPECLGRKQIGSGAEAWPSQ